MKLSERISTMTGTLAGVFFYQLFFKEVDTIISGAFTLSFIIGLVLLYRENSEEKKR